jgi:hypothetical protein
LKVTIIKYGEIKLERVVKNNFEKRIFLEYCKKTYGKGFSTCEVQVSFDKKVEKSHFKKGKVLEKVHIRKANPKTFYDYNK